MKPTKRPSRPPLRLRLRWLEAADVSKSGNHQMKIGLFNKKNYRTENVITGLAKVPLRQAYALLLMGCFFGGPLMLGTMFYILLSSKADSILPIVVVFFCAGFIFLLGLSLPYIVILSSEVNELKKRIQTLETKKSC